MNYMAKRQSFAGLLILLTGFLLLLAGCGGGGGGGSSTPVLNMILINPPSATVSPGGNSQFTATGYDQNGRIMSIDPTWSVTGGIGTVNPESGATTTFTAVDAADTDINGTITATVGEISGNAQITVSADPPVLTTIVIEPANSSFPVNTSQEFTATGYDQFGNALTINPTWSGTGVAVSFSATGSTVSFTPTAAGSGTITASEGYVWGTANITITEAAPATIRVGVDKDYTTIQAAIDAATDGATIIADEGIYNENLTINKSITLKSTNPDSSSVVGHTIINGGGSGTVLWVTAQSGEQLTVNIEGLTITGGGNTGVGISNSYWDAELSVSLKKNIISSNNSSSSGGGVYGTGSNVQLALEGNIIENNSAESEGGGICLNGSYDDKMQVTMTDNTIRNNSADGDYGAGGGIHARDVEGTWSGNTIDGNSAIALAGGIYLFDSSPTIIDNDIIDNEVISDGPNRRGGGIYIEKSTSGICNPTIQNNRISENVAQGSDASSGGGLYIDSASGLTLTGNIISANGAYHGAGIFISADTATLTNNEISDNVANTGGGLYANGSVGISGNQFIGNTATGDGGGVFVSGIGELTGSGNIFNNNAKYAIYLSYGGTWTDEDGNTFSGNTPSDVGP